MQLTEDIDPQRLEDLSKLDEQQRTAVNRVALAVEDANDPNVATASLLADILRAFLSTHYSIRLLLSRTERPEIAADAVSLVREQVEKVFLISLLQAEWETYVPIYFKDTWCKSFRYFLVEKLECERLQRLETYFAEIGPKEFEETRQRHGVSEAVRDLIEFQVLNPGAKAPKQFADVHLPEFPTPGKILKLSSNLERPSLIRWYEEYKYVCGYSHIGADKILMTTATGRKANFSPEQVQILLTKDLHKKAWLSYAACAYAATEVLTRTGGALEPAAEVVKLWNPLLEVGLIFRVFWELRSKALLPLAGLGQSYSASDLK